MITDPDEIARIEDEVAREGFPDCHFPVLKGNLTVMTVFDRVRFRLAIHAGDRIAMDGGGYVERTVDLANATGWDQFVYYPPPEPDLPPPPEPLHKRIGHAARRLLRRPAKAR